MCNKTHVPDKTIGMYIGGFEHNIVLFLYISGNTVAQNNEIILFENKFDIMHFACVQVYLQHYTMTTKGQNALAAVAVRVCIGTLPASLFNDGAADAF